MSEEQALVEFWALAHSREPLDEAAASRIEASGRTLDDLVHCRALVALLESHENEHGVDAARRYCSSYRAGIQVRNERIRELQDEVRRLRVELQTANREAQERREAAESSEEQALDARRDLALMDYQGPLFDREQVLMAWSAEVDECSGNASSRLSK